MNAAVDRESIYNAILDELKKKKYKLTVPAMMPKVTNYDEEVYVFIHNTVLQVLNSARVLGKPGGYGYAESTIALDAIYAGIYGSYCQIHGTVNGGSFYKNMFSDYLSPMGFATEAANKTGLYKGKYNKDKVEAIVMIAMKKAAAYANDQQTAEQVKEVMCALYAFGVLLGLNCFDMVNGLYITQEEFVQTIKKMGGRCDEIHLGIIDTKHVKYELSFKTTEEAANFYRSTENMSNVGLSAVEPSSFFHRAKINCDFHII